MELFRDIAERVNDFLWLYMLIALLLGSGLYFTIRSGFVQFRLFGEMVRSITTSSTHQKREISSLQAFLISMASRVGTGNIAGVAIAISIGGAGAIFWMWVVALISSASSFVETILAQLYKRRREDGFIGGPAYYIESGLGAKWMAIIFAILLIITYGMGFISVQSNTICGAIEQSFGFDSTIVGVVISIITILIIFGGVHRVAKVSSIIVPIMAIGYILIAMVVVALNISQLPTIIYNIFSQAFGWSEAVGGVAGAMISAGIKRGLFSNEAGMGSSPNIAATATVPHPVNQGLIQVLGVFIDTLVICSATALLILLNQDFIDPNASGVQITQLALSNSIGSSGGVFIAIAITLFGFSTIIGSYVCAEMNIRYISKREWPLNLYRIMAGVVVFWGATATLDDTILYTDLFMALMTLCNIAAIVPLFGKAMLVLNDYTRQRRAGVKNPIFRKSEHRELDNQVGIDCWD